MNPSGVPIFDLEPPAGISRKEQEASLSLLNQLNEPFLQSDPANSNLLARMKNYELAFRMQFAVPGALDLDSESDRTREAYGLNDKITEPMGRKCLMDSWSPSNMLP